MIRLGVNIDHIATLREVRKASIPSLIKASDEVRRAGAHQITIHLREDRRHIQDRDLVDLKRWGQLPLNLEMALTTEMVTKALRYRPDCVTLVPERRQEMTTEAGLDLTVLLKKRKILDKLKSKLSLSAFIDPQREQVALASRLGFDAVEFHTGTYAQVFERSRLNPDKQGPLVREVKRLHDSSLYAHELGLEVRAGHGLNEDNIYRMKTLPHLAEVNIGHSLVCDAVFVGLFESVQRMLRLLA